MVARLHLAEGTRVLLLDRTARVVARHPAVLSLPTDPIDSALGRAVRERTEGLVSIKVLLVDDSERFLDSAERFLGAVERIAVVGRARSGPEAVALVERLAPDLVLMDLSMPGMSGLEATRLIKQRLGAPRVIIVSLHDGPNHLAAATAAADAFVGKADFADAVLPTIDGLFTSEGASR